MFSGPLDARRSAGHSTAAHLRPREGYGPEGRRHALGRGFGRSPRSPVGVRADAPELRRCPVPKLNPEELCQKPLRIIALRERKRSKRNPNPEPREWPWWKVYECGSRHRWVKWSSNAGKTVEETKACERCGTAGCHECWPKRRDRALAFMDDVTLPDGRGAYMFTATPFERIRTSEELDAFLDQLRGVLRAAMRTDVREDPFWDGATVVLEVVPHPEDGLSEFVCPHRRPIPDDEPGRPTPKWATHARAIARDCERGMCMLCRGKGVLPVGHVHAHCLVVARPFWYGRASIRGIRETLATPHALYGNVFRASAIERLLARGVPLTRACQRGDKAQRGAERAVRENWHDAPGGVGARTWLERARFRVFDFQYLGRGMEGAARRYLSKVASRYLSKVTGGATGDGASPIRYRVCRRTERTRRGAQGKRIGRRLTWAARHVYATGPSGHVVIPLRSLGKLREHPGRKRRYGKRYHGNLFMYAAGILAGRRSVFSRGSFYGIGTQACDPAQTTFCRGDGTPSDEETKAHRDARQGVRAAGAPTVRVLRLGSTSPVREVLRRKALQDSLSVPVRTQVRHRQVGPKGRGPLQAPPTGAPTGVDATACAAALPAGMACQPPPHGAPPERRAPRAARLGAAPGLRQAFDGALVVSERQAWMTRHEGYIVAGIGWSAVATAPYAGLGGAGAPRVARRLLEAVAERIARRWLVGADPTRVNEGNPEERFGKALRTIRKAIGNLGVTTRALCAAFRRAVKYENDRVKGELYEGKRRDICQHIGRICVTDAWPDIEMYVSDVDEP